MKKLCAKIGVVCVAVLLAGSAFGGELDIQLAPRTLVLSSGGDQLTIHTNFPYAATDSAVLDIGDTCVVDPVTFSDDCGNLVVRCSKSVVAEEVKNYDFERRFTTVPVTLTVNDSASAAKVLRVRK